MPLDSRLLVTDRVRTDALDRLDGLADGSLADPSPAILATVVATAGGPLWLVGGEPTLRADLPAVIRAVAQAHGGAVGLVSDGLGLAHRGRLSALRELGVDRLRVALHAMRPDAHDWLVGREGAWRTAARTLELAAEIGLTTEIEATITRPTTPYLAELVALAERLGADALHLRALRRRGRAAADEIALMPRYALVEPVLVETRRLGVEHDVAVHIHGLPRCAAGSAGHAVVPGSTTTWLAAPGDAWERRVQALAPAPSAGGCGRCPGHGSCDGAPREYVARFGWTELLSEGRGSDGLTDPREERAPETGLPVPDPRAGRVPFTRARVLRMPPAPPAAVPPPPAAVWLDFVDDGGAMLSRRDARLRLVAASQHGARCVRIIGRGAFDHPDAAALLRDATRLSVDRIEVAGDGAGLATMPVRELYLLRRLTRADVALYGPDAARHDARAGREGAFQATLEGAERLARLAQLPVGGYGILRDDDELSAWAEAWDAGRLPGAPAFRLAAEGGSLDRLAASAAAVPPGPTRDALVAVLPPCRFAPDARPGTLPQGVAGSAQERCPRGAQQTYTLVRDAPPSPLDPRGGDSACLGATPDAPRVCAEAAVRYARACPGVPARWSLAPASQSPDHASGAPPHAAPET